MTMCQATSDSLRSTSTDFAGILTDFSSDLVPLNGYSVITKAMSLA
jgi:hypothetical protein